MISHSAVHSQHDFHHSFTIWFLPIPCYQFLHQPMCLQHIRSLYRTLGWIVNRIEKMLDHACEPSSHSDGIPTCEVLKRIDAILMPCCCFYVDHLNGAALP